MLTAVATNSDLGDHSVDLSSIFDLANELNKDHCAKYGPSLEQLERYRATMCDWKEELKIVVSLKTIVHLVSKNIREGSASEDSVDMLQIVSGLILNRLHKAKTTCSDMLATHNLASNQRRELRNKLDGLSQELKSLNEDILDLRHDILNKKGLVGRFRPSHRNLAHAIKVSNKSLNMEVSELEFI